MRTRYQGLWQIMQYNLRFYLGALTGVSLVLLIAPQAGAFWRAVLLASAAPVLWWLGSSMLVSHYVYDLFPLYDFGWLDRCLSRLPRRWVNIHAGLDETSHLLAAKFPCAEGRIFDVYDPREMTEPSIQRARNVTSLRSRGACANWRALPLPDRAIDAAFLIFAAHELRRQAARTELFQEVARVLCIGGELVVVEHLRNCANFLAFGPGFLHFLPERAWRRAADGAGLRIWAHFTLTPFVHVFVMRRSA